MNKIEKALQDKEYDRVKVSAISPYQPDTFPDKDVVAIQMTIIESENKGFTSEFVLKKDHLFKRLSTTYQIDAQKIKVTDDLEFLKEIKEKLVAAQEKNDPTEREYALNMIDDWIGDLEASPTGYTIRQLQESLPWTIKYSRDFKANPQEHKDFAHALTHAVKACGKLAAIVDDLDHRRESINDPDKYIADLVVCALRMANTYPQTEIPCIDLQGAVTDRIESKNNVSLSNR